MRRYFIGAALVISAVLISWPGQTAYAGGFGAHRGGDGFSVRIGDVGFSFHGHDRDRRHWRRHVRPHRGYHGFVAKAVNPRGAVYIGRGSVPRKAIRRALRKCRRDSVFSGACRVVDVDRRLQRWGRRHW